MAAAALAASEFGPHWSRALVIAVIAFAGSTADGYTDVVYVAYAQLGGVRRTEATGLGTAVMFAGVLLLPPGFGVVVATSGGYALAYSILAALAFASAVLLCLGPWSRRAAPV